VTRYLTAEDIVRLNEMVVGGQPIVDFGLLESAALRPQQSVGGQDAYPDLHAKAAALFHSLCRNHAFVNGNKRTAVVAVGVFYGLNGWSLDMDQGEIVALAVDAAEGQLDVTGIAKVLEGHVHPRGE
jgi:death-on-curing protein